LNLDDGAGVGCDDDVVGGSKAACSPVMPPALPENYILYARETLSVGSAPDPAGAAYYSVLPDPLTWRGSISPSAHPLWGSNCGP